MTAMPLRRFFTTVPTDHIKTRSVSRTHVGLIRAINEDRVFDGGDAQLWAVADGMGGHRGGDLAAQAVVNRLRDLVSQTVPVSLIDMLAALVIANDTIRSRNADLAIDAGATIVAAVVEGNTLQVAWAGDSRAYLIRDGVARQLTHDHSFVQELVDAGLLTAAAAERHPQSNVVTRALGVHADPQIETVSADLLAGDRVVLCSDGLSRSLKPDEMVAPTELEPLAERLLAAALARDGSDNVSLVLIAVE